MNCHDTSTTHIGGRGTVVLVGHANVGKSVLFQRLTGQRAVVSNYPGTTVEIAQGDFQSSRDLVALDTPGVVTIPAHAADESVTERVLLNDPLEAVLQVGDAKSLERTLLLTLQLAEMGVPLILVLNMMDEAHARGIRIDSNLLAKQLAVPVVPTIAIRGDGIQKLTQLLETEQVPKNCLHVHYPQEIEVQISTLSAAMPDSQISPRALALLFLSGDQVVERWLEDRLPPEQLQDWTTARKATAQSFADPLNIVIQQAKVSYAEGVCAQVLEYTEAPQHNLASRLGGLALHPLWGIPILAAILYAVYWFVGFFGAQVLVDFLEVRLFGELINPVLSQWVVRVMPIPLIHEFLVGEYGLWTMGITYALALILPVVTTFFIAFGLIEDSGYLPRLAAISNRFFKALGLNGKAVLPMVLGLGCVTMATLTTRTLDNRRDRLLVTLLLALAVPCSAQLGVVMGMLAAISFSATLIWSGVVLLILFAVGWLAAKLVPGERPQFIMQLPPLRWPMLSNVFLKTVARLEWYLKEVVPLFLLGTTLLFMLDKLGALNWLMQVAEPLTVEWLGLPAEASAAFLLGFFRRDFGATGLFIMEAEGLLTALQVVVSMVTITLFIPCIASVMIISKERGWRTALGMVVMIFPLAFLVGGLLFRGLSFIGWGI